MKKRLTYEAPEAEVMRVRFEKNILSEIENVPGSAGDREGGIAGKEYML